MSEREKRTPRPRTEAEARAKAPKNKKKSKVWPVLGTIVLVGVLTVLIFSGIFLRYINTAMRGKVEVYIDEFESKVSTELYYQDPDTEEWVMYETLYMDAENRIWADLDEIPKNLQNATVAIEDKRFPHHKGVDWRGTARAITSTLTGRGVQGGSTITQQLIKNITNDNQDTVKRKVTEIYRALELEKRYEKDEILEAYLNEVYFGESCYGVKTASLMYFGKDVSELDLAECACLIAITNNPSKYEPFMGEWQRNNLRGRQTDVLDAMLDQGKITQAEYDSAYNEEVVFTNGYTILNNYTREHLDAGEVEETEENVSNARNSYFTDAVIGDVAHALIDHYGLTEKKTVNKDTGKETTTSAYSQAISMVYGNGYKIYTTQNYKYQDIAESVFEDVSNIPYTTADGEQLQAAITVVDPYTGYVVAMVGGVGPKPGDRVWNWATEVRPCGSSIKPISTYAPALDDGTITGASTFDDYPVYVINGSAYPKNDNGRYQGLTTMRKALVSSLNTCAVRVNAAYGTGRSYDFMTNRLGFTTLTYTDSQQVGNMALGGLERGVTTEQMAAAYGAFVNEGIYTAPRTFIRVEDANGKVILENEAKSNVAMKASTAAIMNDTLQAVISQGTGGSAYFSGMTMAGKTGTTNSLKDRYFVGYTPYYSAAVWTGYKSNVTVSSGGTNPAAVMWKLVMSQIHKDLENKSFFSCGDLTYVSTCADSGMLATEACANDPRGSRVVSSLCSVDNIPGGYCTMHGGSGYLDYDRPYLEAFPDIMAEDEEYLLNHNPFAAITDWWDDTFGDGYEPYDPEGDQDTGHGWGGW